MGALPILMNYYVPAEPVGLPTITNIIYRQNRWVFHSKMTFIHISAEPVGLPSKMIHTLVEPVGLPKLTKYHILVERGV